MIGTGEPSINPAKMIDRLDTDFALHAAGLGVWEFDTTTNQLVWDAQCRALAGLPDNSQLSSESAAQYIHRDDIDRFQKAVQWASNPASTGVFDEICRIAPTTTGVIRKVHLWGQAYFNPAGKLTRFGGVAQAVAQDAMVTSQGISSEQQLYTVIEQAPLAIALFKGEDMVFEVCNEVMLTIIGKDKSVLGRPLADAVPELEGQGFMELQQRVYATGEPYFGYGVPAKLAGDHGLDEKYFDFSYTPMRDPDGRVVGVLVSATDVSRQVRAHQKIAMSEAHMELLRNTVPAMIFYLDGEQRYRSYNQTFMQWFGVDSTSAIGKTVREFIGDEVYQSLFPHLTRAYAGELETFEVRAPARMGSKQWLRIVYTPHKTPEGVVQGIIVLVTDITESKQIELSLRDSEARFRSLIEEAPVATCLFVGTDLVMEVINESMLAIFGKGDQIQGMTLTDAVPEMAIQVFPELLREVMRTGKTYVARGAKADLIKNGQSGTYYLDLTHKPLRNGDGEVYAVLTMAIDVTEQTLARQKLEESEMKLRSVILSAPSLIAIALLVGRDLIIDSPNQAFLDTVGKGNYVEGKSLAAVMPELERQPFLHLLDTVYTTGQPYQSFGSPVTIVKNGVEGQYYFNVSFTPLLDAQGAVYAILDISVDVTDQIVAHQKIEESEARYRNLATHLEDLVRRRTHELDTTNEQLASTIEELAATNEELTATNEEIASSNQDYIAINNDLQTTIALLNRSNDNLQRFAYVASHDLQEPLRKIQQFGNLLKTEHAAKLGDEQIYLDRMQAAAERMSSLIRDLLSYSHITARTEVREPVSLDQVVRQVLTDLELVIQEKNAQIYVDLLPTIIGDASQLGQLFQNLVSNALKFHRPGAHPVVTVRAQHILHADLPEDVVPIHQTPLYHLIEVADNGIGFDPQYTGRIFEAFQRLHRRHEYSGTGIGLSISERVVTSHGGAIKATSQPGQGATFSVYLPV